MQHDLIHSSKSWCQPVRRSRHGADARAPDDLYLDLISNARARTSMLTFVCVCRLGAAVLCSPPGKLASLRACRPSSSGGSSCTAAVLRRAAGTGCCASASANAMSRLGTSRCSSSCGKPADSPEVLTAALACPQCSRHSRAPEGLWRACSQAVALLAMCTPTSSRL